MVGAGPGTHQRHRPDPGPVHRPDLPADHRRRPKWTGVLGEDARLRGALADEIPNIPDTAGIGYVIRPRTRTPMRVRAAYVDDREITELITFVQTRPTPTGEPGGRTNLEVVA